MHHMCETWSQHTWCLCSRPGFGPLKSGCDRYVTDRLTLGRGPSALPHGAPPLVHITVIGVYIDANTLFGDSVGDIA
jgi:hypothetical protein